MLLKKHNVKKRSQTDDFDASKEKIPGPAYLLLLQNLENHATPGTFR